MKAYNKNNQQSGMGNTIMNTQTSFTRLGFIVVVLALLSGSVPANVTRLQVFSSATLEGAERSAARIEKAGMGPALVQASDDGTLYRVYTKTFDSKAEANFARTDLAAIGYLDAYAVSLPADRVASRQVNLNTLKLPKVKEKKLHQKLGLQLRATAEKPSNVIARGRSGKRPELKSDGEMDLYNYAQALSADAYHKEAHAAYADLLAKYPTSQYASKAELRLAYLCQAEGDTEGARHHFTRIATDHPNTPECAEALLRLGYFALSQGKEAQALKAFHRVAFECVDAAPVVRLEAATRAAALYHRGRDLETADHLYRLIEQAAGDEKTRAFAALQCVGLTLERAWNGKKTFADARTEADAVLANYPRADKSVRATAAVIAIETHMYEGDPQSALKREAAFIREFKGTDEEAIGCYWLGTAHVQVGNVDRGNKLLTAAAECLDKNPQIADRFSRVDVGQAIQRLTQAK
jgi:TolA-binding protein